MKWRMTVLVLATALATTSSVFAADDLTGGEKMAVEALIKQFTDRSFAARQKAVDRLVEIGPKVVPLIQKTLGETSDNEVKLRCRMVLDGIGKKYGIAVTPDGPAPGKFGIEASKVTVKLTDAELDEVLQVLAEQSGNKLVKHPQNWEGKTISLNVTDMPYWQALDEVCKRAGLTYAGDYQSRSLKLVPVEDHIDITAYAGPVVVKLASGTRRKDFRGMKTRRRAFQASLMYLLSYYMEDRLKPLTMQATVTKAVAPDGTELTLPARAGMGAMAMSTVRASYGTIYVTINDSPENLQKIARFDGTVKMNFGSGKRVLKIKDVFGEGDRSVEDDDTVVKVEKVWRKRAGFVTISLSQTEDGKAVNMPRYPSTSEYGFELVDPDGGRHKSYVSYGYGAVMQGKQDGKAQPKGKLEKQERKLEKQERKRLKKEIAGRVVADRVEVFLAANGPGEVVVAQAPVAPAPAARVVARRRSRNYASFRNVPDIDGEWTLVYTMPLKTVEKTFDFTIKDIPMP